MKGRHALAALILACVTTGCRSDAATAVAPTRVDELYALHGSASTGATFTAEVLQAPAGNRLTEAVAINASGDAVGYGHTLAGSRALLWHGTVMTDLGLPAGAVHAAAADINDAGGVIVQAWNSAQVFLGSFTWQGGTFTPLPSQLYAEAINNSGVVVGFRNGAGAFHALRYTPGVGLVDLHPSTGGYAYSVIKDISDAGDMVGFAALPNNDQHAAVWLATGSFMDLNGLAGHTESTAESVNRAGIVVGYAVDTGFTNPRPFVWSLGGGMRLGTRYGFAYDISGRGRITGSGRVVPTGPETGITKARNERPTPVPLPPGATSALPLGVNECGSMVGGGFGASPPRIPMRWTISVCDP